MRWLVIVRDTLLALALGWIGISIEPAAPPAEKVCPASSGASPASCTGARTPSLSIGGGASLICGDN